GLVHNIAYMIDPMAEAYGILLMRSVISCVVGHIDLERFFPCDIGINPFFERSMLNLFSILSMYVDCERPINLLKASPESPTIGGKSNQARKTSPAVAGENAGTVGLPEARGGQPRAGPWQPASQARRLSMGPQARPAPSQAGTSPYNRQK